MAETGPDITVLDSNLKPLLPIVDTYSSLQWISNWSNVGTFELHAPVDFADVLLSGEYVFRPDDEENQGIIDDYDYELTDKGVENIVVKGRFLNAILDQRVIDKTYIYSSGHAQSLMFSLVEDFAIDPTNTDRIIDKLIVGDLPDLTGWIENYQNTGDTLMVALDKIALFYAWKWYVKYDIAQDKLIFKVRAGTDRFAGVGYKEAIFSVDYENIASQKYQRKKSDWKNIAYVAGAGEGTDRIVETVDLIETGEPRRELYVDARDLRQKDSDGNDISESDYRDMLVQRGHEKLAEHRIISNDETAINQFGNLVYGEDFGLGDVCTIVNPRINYQANERLTTVREIYENGSKKIEAVFGTSGVTLKQYIDRRVKNA